MCGERRGGRRPGQGHVIVCAEGVCAWSTWPCSITAECPETRKRPTSPAPSTAPAVASVLPLPCCWNLPVSEMACPFSSSDSNVSSILPDLPNDPGFLIASITPVPGVPAGTTTTLSCVMAFTVASLILSLSLIFLLDID